MKKLILLVNLLAITLGVLAQNDTTRYTMVNGYGFSYTRLKAKAAFVMPTDTVQNKLPGSVVLLNDTLYLKTATRWEKVSASPTVIDTTVVSTRAWRQKGDDSVSALVALRVRISDTSAMLLPYLRKSDTLTLSVRIDQRVKYTDTAAMLAPYAKAIAGLPIGGTAGQILAKNSATNYDAIWIDNYTEDVRETVKASQAINKGQAVYVTGADGTNVIVAKASNTGDATSSKTLGLLYQNLANNGIGFVITEGRLDGLNTLGATVGDPVWLGTNGNLLYGLANKPVAPAHLVYIGVVTRVNANNGEIFVHVQNGFELEELHNVLITDSLNSQVIAYDSTSRLWKNRTIASVLGYTPVKTTDTASMLAPYLRKADTTAMLSPYARTATVNAQLASKLNISDTSGMLTPYLRKVDTATLSNRINLKLNISDTASMLSPYYRTATATAALATKLNITDTSGMLTPYVRAAGYGLTKSGQTLSVDTAAIATTARVQKAVDSLGAAKQNTLTNPLTGTGTTNYVAKFTNTSTLGNSMIFDNGTNVGIGTTSPAGIFHVQTANQEVSRFVSTATQGPYMAFQQGSTPTTVALLGSYPAASGGGGLFTVNDFMIRAQGNMVFSSGGATERAVLNTSGELLIGTTNDVGAYALQVGGSIYNTTGAVLAANSGGLLVGTTAFADGNDKLQLQASVAGAYGMRIANGSLDAAATSRITFDTQGGAFYLEGTRSNNEFKISRNTTEVFRINGSGNVGIGTSNPSYKLDVNGTGRVNGQFTTKADFNITFISDGLYGATALPSIITTPNGGNILLGYYSSGDGSYYGRIGTLNGSSKVSFGAVAANVFTINTGDANTERMRIDANGNVGIGTTAPSEALHVVGRGRFTTIDSTSSPINVLTSDVNGVIRKTSISATGVQGSGTTNYIAKFTGSGTVGNSVAFDNGGNELLVNTTTDNGNFALQVNGNQYVSGGLSINTTTPATNKYIRIAPGGGLEFQWSSGGTSGLMYSYNDYDLAINNNNSDIRFERVSGKILMNPTTTNEVLINTSTDAGAYALQVAGSIYNTTGAVLAASSGNVGIGTTNPAAKLDIRTSSTVDIYLISTNPLNQENSIQSYYNSGGGWSNFSIKSNNIFYYTGPTSGPTVERMRITSAGNVGIGTTSPAYTLDLSTSNDGRARQWIADLAFSASGNESAGFQVRTINSTTAGVRFLNYSANTEWMRISAGGDVGIGTTNPLYKLHVEGNAYIRAAAGYNVLFQNSSTTLRMNYLNDAGSANISAAYRASDYNWQDGSGNPIVTLNSAAELLVNTTTDAGAYALQVSGDIYNTAGTAFTINSGALKVGHTSTRQVTDTRTTYTDNTLYDPIFYTGHTTYGGSGMRNRYMVHAFGGNDLFGPQFTFVKTRGSNTNDNTIVASGDAIGAISWQATDGTRVREAAAISSVVTGTPASDNISADLLFFTRLTTNLNNEKMRITSAGNVGIGTTSPTAKLQVNGTTVIGTGSATGLLTVRDLSTSTAIVVDGGPASSGIFSARNNGTENGYFSARGDISSVLVRSTNWTMDVGTEANQHLTLTTSGAERMRITSGGAVGIGTTPLSVLHMNGGTGLAHFRVTEANNLRGFVGGANGIISGYTNEFAIRAESGLILSGAGNSVNAYINSSAGELIIANGNTDAGDYKLQVNGNSYFNGGMTIFPTSSFGTTIVKLSTATAAMQIYNNGGTSYFGTDNSTGGNLFTGSLAYSTAIGSGTNTALHLATNNIVRATVSTAGNLLINTTTDLASNYKLQVNGDIYSNGLIYTVGNAAQIWAGSMSNKEAIVANSQSITGANNQAAINVSSTWNTTGSPSLIDLYIVNTASGANANYIQAQDSNGGNIFRVTKDAGVITGIPTGGSSSKWKLGEVATVSPTSPNRTIRVEIDGTVYYIHAKTTNN